ncbi:hypothetical protein SRHO_G00223700 [Serrasalmus rhombeus]
MQLCKWLLRAVYPVPVPTLLAELQLLLDKAVFYTGLSHCPHSSTTALTCVLHCFPCEPSWADRPFLLRSRAVSPATATMTRSKTFQAYLPNCHRTYSCIHCRAHLANHDELISKSFQGSQGRAYLFNSVVNVGCGPAEERVLLTGLHAVADIYCENCKTTLGWKYICTGADLVTISGVKHINEALMRLRRVSRGRRMNVLSSFYHLKRYCSLPLAGVHEYVQYT